MNKYKAILKIEEIVYKEIAKQPQNLGTLKARVRQTSKGKNKNFKISNEKIENAVESLRESGKVILKDGIYSPASAEIVKSGRFFDRSKGGYVLFDDDINNRQHAVSRENSNGFSSNQRVSVLLKEKNGKIDPIIVSKLEEKKENSILDSLPVKDVDLIPGRVTKKSHDSLVFIPNDRRYTRNILIINQPKDLPKYENKICYMKICERVENGTPTMGYITGEPIGDAGNPIEEYRVIAENCGATISWSSKELAKEIKEIPTEVDLSDKTLISEKDIQFLNGGGKSIVDLRHLAFTTVDPATCKDMDDSIYSCIDENDRLVVYTAVANVTKYVDLNTEIGRRYIQGGFTVYTPNQAYGILPPELSTGICSLNPNVDRLALVIKTIIDEKTGEPISSTFMDAVINSKEKYSYERAQEICDENSGIKYEDLKKKLIDGEKLTKEEQVIFNSKVSDILWKNFNNRNSISFETRNEYNVHLNERGDDIVDITAQEHIPYHKVIEGFMLTANEASAKFCLENNIPNIYRVHDMPNESKLAMAYEFFGYLEKNLNFDGDLSPMGIKRLVASVKGEEKYEKVVNNFLVRLQCKAKYNNSPNPKGAELVINKDRKRNVKCSFNISEEELKKQIEESMRNMEDISHFGLQSKHYSHTTSPIRRISDYVTHKNILAFLHGEEMIDERTVLEIAQWANQMQDSVDQAERELDDLNSAIYCEHHIGDIMNGTVCSFKKLREGKDLTAEDIIVLVEDEEKGVKVQIPASELLKNNTKNVTISMYGSAVINKNISVPIIRLCDKVQFRIKSADRIAREVYATTNLQKETDIDSLVKVINISNDVMTESTDSAHQKHCAKKQRMLQNVKYNSDHTHSLEYRDETQEKRGKKHKERIISRTGIEEIDSRQAFIENKQAQIKYKKRKNQSIEESYEDYDENF